MSLTQGSQRSTTTRLQDLPAYEPPIGPLTPNSQRVLARLLQNEGLKNAQRHVQEASSKVSNAAGDINEKLTEAKQRHERYLASQRKRREKMESQDGEGEMDVDGDGGGGDSLGRNIEEEETKFREREAEVKRLTTALEEKIRRIVDSDVMLEDVKTWLGDAVKEIDEGATRQRGRRQLRRRQNDDDEEEDGDEDWNGDENEHNPSNEYSQRLAQDIKSRRADWSAQSLTQRYSNNNTYVSFYRLVHDAKHPGNEIPPVPHSSTWFQHLEDPDAIDRNPPSSSRPAAKRTHRGARRSSPTAPDDDDVAIAREKTSLKCPLTLVQFVDPVTSTKCPHSFEKEAIHGMLSSSQLTVPAPEGSSRRRVKAVKCPVCEVQLSADDLKDDLVLVRRVKRMQELMARMDEDQDEDEDDDESGSEGGGRRKRSRKGRQSGITLASDDYGSEGESESNESEERPVRIKQEALSQGT